MKTTNITSLLPDSVVLFTKTARSCFQNVPQSSLQCQGITIDKDKDFDKYMFFLQYSYGEKTALLYIKKVPYSHAFDV